MSKKRKYSVEEIIQICEDYLSSIKSSSELCREHHLSNNKPPGIFWRWIAKYRENGRAAFFESYFDYSGLTWNNDSIFVELVVQYKVA